jgi:ADP-ribose pyrophosphatase YjhB (NUDIX family)
MDFFSILLPGVVLSYLLMSDWGLTALGALLDAVYDWFRRRTLNRQISRVASGRRLSPWLLRVVTLAFLKDERDLAVRRAIDIEESALNPLKAENAVNAFQWAKALLLQESPESLAVVHRFEADSKFFRCFVFVLFLMMLTWGLHDRWPTAGLLVPLALLLLAFWRYRYMEQRHEATKQAYWSVISLTEREAAQAKGGVVYRDVGGKRGFLFVESKKDIGRWVLPKGHIEHKETPREAAIREVLEETSVWARVEKDLNPLVFQDDDGKKVTVTLFLMQPIGKGRLKEHDRGASVVSFPVLVRDGPGAATS